MAVLVVMRFVIFIDSNDIYDFFVGGEPPQKEMKWNFQCEKIIGSFIRMHSRRLHKWFK